MHQIYDLIDHMYTDITQH